MALILSIIVVVSVVIVSNAWYRNHVIGKAEAAMVDAYTEYQLNVDLLVSSLGTTLSMAQRGVAKQDDFDAIQRLVSKVIRLYNVSSNADSKYWSL